MKRFISIFLSILITQSLLAQTIGQWSVYPSYMNAHKCVSLGSMVYTLTEGFTLYNPNNPRLQEFVAGNLFSYDAEDESVTTYNSIDQLNDVQIVEIGASDEAKRIIIVYKNGNIDLMDMDGNVMNISALKDKIMASKDINSVTIVGKTAYICTSFGFIIVDMKEGVIEDTYNIGQDIQAFMMKDNQPYLALKNKTVLTIEKEGNWHLSNLWKATTEVKYQEFLDQNPEYVQAGGLFWHAEGMNGLVGYKDRDGVKTKARGPIQPNSPVRDLTYRMNFAGDRLLVAGGVNTPFPVYHPATAMIFEDGKWSYLDEETPAKDYPGLFHWNTTHITQDPNDPEHHFASPYRTGLYEYRYRKLVKIYSIDNSPISQIQNFGKNYVPAVAPTYDEEGNLWLLNSETDTIIRILQPNGKWLSLYYDEIAETPTPTDYLFTTSGVKFMVSRRVNGRGFFGLHTGSSLSSTRDDHHVLRTFITNQDGTTYDISEFNCMAEDLDGRVWCGTTSGLFVINNPLEYFDADFRFEQIKIAREDGSGLADYLLNGVNITYIAVDGANRKWVGTTGNGLYLISADGQEMIQHFTAEETPLLSNNVQCLAIHPRTGVIMIGTDIGLCSYVGDATQPEEDLQKDNVVAYPNPVTPDFQGMIAIKGLTQNSEVKICSSSGQLVWSGVSNGGTCTWNGCNKQGKRVASGIYHVIANNSEGEKAVVTRIIVIK